MHLNTLNCKDIQTLIPLSAVPVDGALHKSIAEHGVIVPPVICEGLLCNGHRRLNAAMAAGLETITCIAVAGTAGLVFGELNRHREITSYEAAIIFKSLPTEKHSTFLEAARISESPQMKHALNFIADEIQNGKFLFEQNLPLNIWRELGHLADFMPVFARQLMALPGTVGEKRNIASALRQLHRKNALPDSLTGNNAAEVFTSLQKTAQPRRTGALDKFNQAMQNAELPTGATINIDPTFSQPGMQITLSVRRHSLDRLVQLQKAVEKIFNEVEEL